MIRIFISRDLKSDSIFKSGLEGKDKLELIAFSLISFEKVDIVALPKAHWYFFYSSKGVDFFLGQLRKIETGVKLATMGNATAHTLRGYGYKVDFVGSGNPSQTSEDFRKQVARQSVLFIQAQESRRSVEKLLRGQIQTKSLVAYKNTPRKIFKNPNADILVFTSPMNVQSYCSLYKLEARQKVVGIGKTTAKELDKYQITDYKIAEKASEKGLLDCVRDILEAF